MLNALIRSFAVLALVMVASGCSSGLGSCDDYASEYSCNYVENEAEYEVWYWRNLQSDNEEDETLIGRARGLQMCEGNARAFATATGEGFNARAYICVLIDDGRRMEKHRLLSNYEPQ